jgi:uncharacterized protein (UPF0548 family)
MPQQTLFRRLTTATRWPVGVALTSWRYMWRTTPLYRTEEVGAWSEDAPPGLPSGVSHDKLQGPRDGAGPLFHRRYVAIIRRSRLSPEQLIERVASDPDRAAPSEFATFKKTHGREGEMAVGDEFLVRMPGPWDGPVRVIERTACSFRLATLEGHLEAGQIQFSAEEHGEAITFRIESWARAGDRLSNLLYDRLRISKEVQFHMWTSFLERVIKLAGGERDGGLRLHTRRVEPPPSKRPLADPESLRRVRALHDVRVNFDPASRAEMIPARGWKVDDYCQPLPAEAPGSPEPDGSWERARRLMERYEFADPAIVRAIYAPDSDLAGRDMLLEARFWGLRFHLGVRVSAVIDGERVEDGRPIRAWGWSYRTLQGHLEMGQMDYEVLKRLDDGSVEFRIHVVSRPARISNPIVRLGFLLFGRREQTKFARNACQRMAGLLAGEAVTPTGDNVSIAPR